MTNLLLDHGWIVIAVFGAATGVIAMTALIVLGWWK